MLELLFQGFVEWLYGLTLECWEYFASVLFELMSLDFAYLREHMPVIDTIRQIMLGVGWALLIGNLVFQATRGMAAGLGFEAEDPKLLFTRTFAFSFLLVASPQICELGLNMTSTVIELLQMPDAVDITFADEVSFAGMAGAWLLVVICGIVVMFQTFKLIMEMAERYFILAVLTITSPLAFGMGGSRNTSDIFTGWCRMFGSMCLLMATNVMFVKMLLSVLSYYPSGLDVLPWMVLVVTIVKVAKKADSILARIGLNPAMTGDPLGRGFPGAMTMMVVRSLVSNAARTIGRNGGQPRSGSGGNPKPSTPAGPRTGGAGSTSNVNAPSYANGYHHSTSAQQNSVSSASAQETASTQTDTVQSAAEKMAGAFSQATPSANGGQPNSTHKTAVPPGTRRAPGHVPVSKNSTAPSAEKAAPGAPYHPAGTAQSVVGGAVEQNTQQEQSVHSRAESHPRSNASVQNRGGTVLSGTAGNAATQNPPRSSVQSSGIGGKSYHANNMQPPNSAGDPTVRDGTAGIRSTSHSAEGAHSAPSHDTAGNGTRSQQAGDPRNTPTPGTAGTQRTSIGGRYTQPVQQAARVSTNGNVQITQQNHVSTQQSSGAAQPTDGRADGRTTLREHSTSAAPSSSHKADTPPRSTTRSDIAHSTEQHASPRPIPAQNGSAEKPMPQAVTHTSPASAAPSERQSRKPATHTPAGGVTAPSPASQESRGSQRSTAAEPSAKRPILQERKTDIQSEPQKKEQTLYHRPGTAGIAPMAVGITTTAPSAAQKPSAEKAVRKPFVPLTGRTPESIPSHLDLHKASQKTTKRPQADKQEVTPDV